MKKCMECSKQRTEFKRQDTYKQRRELQNIINDYEPKYRNNQFKSEYQSLHLEKEADREFHQRLATGRDVKIPRRVFKN